MKKTALLFAGQGAQKVGMGKDLAEHFPTARAVFDRANETLGYDLRSVCWNGPEGDLTKTEHAQPGIFLVGWIAFQILMERVPGLNVHATAGLSLGEFTALTAANVFSFEDGLKIVRARGGFMQEACEATRGGMAAIIGLDVEATREVCQQSGVEVANLNCPGQIVISGETEKLKAACDLAKTRGAKRALPLAVAGAYHSRLMERARLKLAVALDSVTLHEPKVPVISNVSARPHGSSPEIRRLLVEQVTSSVRWEESIRNLLGEGFSRFIELGPGTALSGFMKRIDSSVEVLSVGDLPSLEATASALTNAP